MLSVAKIRARILVPWPDGDLYRCACSACLFDFVYLQLIPCSMPQNFILLYQILEQHTEQTNWSHCPPKKQHNTKKLRYTIIPKHEVDFFCTQNFIQLQHNSKFEWTIKLWIAIFVPAICLNDSQIIQLHLAVSGHVTSTGLELQHWNRLLWWTRLFWCRTIVVPFLLQAYKTTRFPLSLCLCWT